MDDPRDKLRNSNDNLGNKPREKGITFLVVDYFPFFSFFFYLRFQREERGERCPSSLQTRSSRNRNCVSRDEYFTTLETRPANRLFARRDASNFRTFFSGSFFGERRKKKKFRIMVNSFTTFHTTHARLPVYPILLFLFSPRNEIVQPIQPFFLPPPVPLFFKYACFSRRDDPSFSATEKFRTMRPSPLSLSLSFSRCRMKIAEMNATRMQRVPRSIPINTAIEYR